MTNAKDAALGSQVKQMQMKKDAPSGWPSSEQFDQALEQFKGTRMLIATGLTEKEIENEPPGHCRMEYVYKEKAKCWDGYIISYPNEGHEAAVGQLFRVFNDIANSLQDAGFLSIGASCGGHKILKRTSDGRLKQTDPDDVLVIDHEKVASKYVVVGEIEVRHRSSIELQDHFKELFGGWSSLQVGIGITVGCRENDDKGPFGCVAFVYRRDAQERMYVDRIFQIGLREYGTTIDELKEKWKELGIAHPSAIIDRPQEFKDLVERWKKQDEDGYITYQLPRKWNHKHFQVQIEGSELCGDFSPNELFDISDENMPSSWPPDQTIDLYPVVQRLSQVLGKYFDGKPQ